MRAVAATSWLLLGASVAACGCAQNSLALQGQNQTLQAQQLALTQRNQELQTRATSLDRDNQELASMLAQSRQQTQVMQDQVVALRDQLGGATSQLAQLKTEYEETNRKAETLAASVRRRTTASISPNNSLQDRLPVFDVPGVQARADGDVIRIELASAGLFESGSARLLQQAGPLLDRVIAQILRTYPYQMIGIEGHTDADALKNSKWASNQQLSVGRAMAVYDHLAGRTGVNPGQMFVVGHGANHPVVSNGTEAGKQRNRRVELVVYPDRAPIYQGQ